MTGRCTFRRMWGVMALALVPAVWTHRRHKDWADTTVAFFGCVLAIMAVLAVLAVTGAVELRTG